MHLRSGVRPICVHVPLPTRVPAWDRSLQITPHDTSGGFIPCALDTRVWLASQIDRRSRTSDRRRVVHEEGSLPAGGVVIPQPLCHPGSTTQPVNGFCCLVFRMVRFVSYTVIAPLELVDRISDVTVRCNIKFLSNVSAYGTNKRDCIREDF
jgi:hypothetical protein